MHAERAFAELPDDHQKAICEKVFQAITDKGTDARGIRRPTSAGTLRGITGASLEEITAVLAVFRKPSRSFVMPPVGETITDDTVIDISHESLMRIWNRLKAWVDDEAESAGQYQRLAENATRHAKGTAGLMTDPELSLMLDWKEKRQWTEVWGDRYRPGFPTAIKFLEESRIARDKAVAEEKERQRRELRRTRIVAGVMGAAFLISVALGSFALYEQRRTAEEQRHTAAAQAAEIEAEKTAEIQKQLTQQANDARQEAETQKTRAEAAEELAKQERDIATRTAQAFITAIKAQASAQLAAIEQLEKEEILNKDRAAKAAPDVIARDQAEVKKTTADADRLRLDAANKSAEAAAIVANAHLLPANRISGSDLFDVSRGDAQITGYSGAASRGGDPACDPGCGTVCGNTRYPADMFTGSGGSECRATVFADGQPAGTKHWIEWKTKREVTVRSVGLYAAHDAIRLRRSFSTFNLFVKKGGKWDAIATYSPALMYGGKCGTPSCFPPPAKQYTDGSVLSACINVAPATGQEFRAEFVQGTSSLETFSGPRVLQLDGYSQPDCKK